MVPGMNGKNRRSSSVQVDYLVQIEDIKPWPPSQSLRSLRSVLIQWENGYRNSGSTNTVVPSLGTVVGEGKIEFNESFRLPVTLLREVPVKGKDTDTFQKNCLEFNLYEPRRDKAQLLATAVVDLADYGVIKETISLTAPVNSKRSFRSTPQPILYFKIQPIDKGRTISSSLSKGVSMDKNGGESVSALMNEEYAEEAEVSSFTDDESPPSSLTNGGLPPQNEEIESGRMTESKHAVKNDPTAASQIEMEKNTIPQEKLERSSSYSSSIDLSSDAGSPVNDHASVMNSAIASPLSILKDDVAQSVLSSSAPSTYKSKEEEVNTSKRSNDHQDLLQEVHGKLTNSITTIRRCDIFQNNNENISSDKNPHVGAKLGTTTSGDFQVNLECSQNGDEQKQFSEDEPIDNFPYDARDDDSLGSDTFTSPGGIDMKGNILKIDRLKHVKSVRSSSDSLRSNGFGSRMYNEVGLMRDAHHSAGSLSLNERKNAKIHPKDTRTTILDGKIQKLEHKIKMLEGELKEAAAIEAALYSVISEHGSSMSKVHAPARRLSRLYLHACRESFQSRRASAARSAISGLVLVAKACGNDVPRLTFWLSNSVVLRTIISQTIGDTERKKISGQHTERKGNKIISSSLKWKEVSPSRKGNNVLYEDSSDWEDPHAFTSALERVEAWIFSRIIESIWWQTLTPHMQVAATEEIARLDSSVSKKKLGKTSRLVHEDQGNISLEHWKKAFKDACERLCPVRAGGHECGCLPVLARLIMEQCVARLDVAMFNAILRESVDEIPSDPVSDPISDPIVLPIPAGTSSFAAGAQLKNVIGNWSRWLTDLFGMDADDLLEDDNENNEIDERPDTTFKSFHLLNALSDLMMLPKDMLLSKSIRKEVCPTFAAPMIKRVLDNFVSDEFCPDPIPDIVFEALDVEDAIEAGEESVSTVPCIAAPPIYLPPSAASIAKIIGEFGSQSKLRKSGSSIVRKSYTSDDELDELNSPLASIVLDGVRSSPGPTKASWKSRKGIDNTIRYELLREIWMNSE
ncbi:hypothetical protein OIU84_024947 [Salix udensis]|uniref:C2 NT-type domain-containing protein n=1 Tax=Salix udensis TaxID=889485 RepID=A0AAD6KIH6_9ROSI|nr:hypothetical protein OIU84_024947 [Salix udensis]